MNQAFLDPEVLILEFSEILKRITKKASNMRSLFMMLVYFWRANTLPQNNTKNPIKTMCFRLGKPAISFDKQPGAPSCLQEETLRQKSVKVEEAKQSTVLIAEMKWPVNQWLPRLPLRQQGGLGISWEIGMCKNTTSTKTSCKIDCDFATFGIFNSSMFNLFELKKTLKIPSNRIDPS